MKDIELRRQLILAGNRFRKIRMGKLFTDISHGEFILLQMIREYAVKHPLEEGINVSKIAIQQKVSPPAVSRALSALEKKGWVERKVSKEDRRNTYVYITPEGERKAEESARVMDHFMLNVIRKMGREKVMLLIQLCNELSDTAEAELRQYEKET